AERRRGDRERDQGDEELDGDAVLGVDPRALLDRRLPTPLALQKGLEVGEGPAAPPERQGERRSTGTAGRSDAVGADREVGGAEELFEQHDLAQGEVELAPGAPGLTAPEVEAQVLPLERLRLQRPLTPRQGADAREQLYQRHRLADVVVGAQVQARDAVAEGV